MRIPALNQSGVLSVALSFAAACCRAVRASAAKSLLVRWTANLLGPAGKACRDLRVSFDLARCSAER